MAEPNLEKNTDAVPGSSGNRLLDIFLQDNRGVKSALQLVTFRTAQIVHRQDRPISYAYFPVAGALALTVAMRDGEGCGGISVGHEGLIGLPLYLGQTSSPYTVIQQTEGKCYRMGAPTFLGSIRRSPRLQTLMQRYCDYTLRFAHQTAACNALHTIKQRACRWLLLMQDRAGTEQFVLPQALMAEMLGVRRQSVSEVSGDMRRQGLIEYRRGMITLVDREKLEKAACCECYEVMNEYYHRMLDGL